MDYSAAMLGFKQFQLAFTAVKIGLPRLLAKGPLRLDALAAATGLPADRLSRIFLRNEQGRRPVYGWTEKFQSDPHWRDLILFYEYFHGDNGAGLGASHQTGWTGCVAKTIQLFGLLDPKRVLEGGKKAAFKHGDA